MREAREEGEVIGGADMIEAIEREARERANHDRKAYHAALVAVIASLRSGEYRNAERIACVAIGETPPEEFGNADVPGGVCGECGSELEEDRVGAWICRCVECPEYLCTRAEGAVCFVCGGAIGDDESSVEEGGRERHEECPDEGEVGDR